MPNKRNPNRDVDDFLGTLQSLQDLWVEMFDVLKRADVPAVDRERLHKESGVDAFLRASVAFEGFRSDWHITAMHRDSRRYRTTLQERIFGKLGGETSLKEACKHIDVRIPHHLTFSRRPGGWSIPSAATYH